jgi:hypothetical protein
MQQSVSLLRVKDPLFKRMGASRLARFAKDGNLQLHYLYLSSQITWNLYFNYLWPYIEALCGVSIICILRKYLTFVLLNKFCIFFLSLIQVI